MSTGVPEFGYKNPGAKHTVAYLRPQIQALMPACPTGGRALDLGCGNGYWSGVLEKQGWTVVGVDASQQGIDIARKAFPKSRFEVELIDPGLPQRLNEPPLDLIVSFEVVEHMYAPREWAACAHGLLKPGGTFICSTPYHGYVKNLALALAGKWSRHLDPLWDGGHVKFFDRFQLQKLLVESGLTNVQFRGAGRAPLLWMSMVLAATQPNGPRE